jgi:hypothetical protein
VYVTSDTHSTLIADSESLALGFFDLTTLPVTNRINRQVLAVYLKFTDIYTQRG